ncbi:MAG: hypothetical protein D6680_17985 [Cyanobacteria bacterium J007]|nr:MAG: hypothetical protein D6680_17985 [Cyanobacteria bacterium J007]
MVTKPGKTLLSSAISNIQPTSAKLPIQVTKMAATWETERNQLFREGGEGVFMMGEKGRRESAVVTRELRGLRVQN